MRRIHVARTLDAETEHGYGTQAQDTYTGHGMDTGHGARTRDTGQGYGTRRWLHLYVVGMIFNSKNLVEMPELWLSLRDTNSVALHDMRGGDNSGRVH